MYVVVLLYDLLVDNDGTGTAFCFLRQFPLLSERGQGGPATFHLTSTQEWAMAFSLSLSGKVCLLYIVALLVITSGSCLNNDQPAPSHDMHSSRVAAACVRAVYGAQTADGRPLTPGLTTCLCPEGRTNRGDICNYCRRLVFVAESNSKCEGCSKKGTAANPLVPCGGCNVVWHASCHTQQQDCDLRFGMGKDKAVAFCSDCYEECRLWVECDVENASFIDVNFKLPPPGGREVEGKTPKKKKRKAATREPRDLKRIKAAPIPTTCGNEKCKKDGCSLSNMLSLLRCRQQYIDVRCDRSPGAIHDSLQLIFDKYMKVVSVPEREVRGRGYKKHPDQKCSYCSKLNKSEWKKKDGKCVNHHGQIV